MDCERCGDAIEPGDEREYCGRNLCEDCYMDALSPVRTCDPWAVHCAKSFPEGMSEDGGGLNPVQQKILDVLKETGPIPLPLLVEKVQVKPTDMDREFAALRHMEKIRAELVDGKKLIRLW